LQLKNLKEFRNICGGQAIEMAAIRGDPRAIDLGTFMTNYKDCNFSYSGIKNAIRTHILKSEKQHGNSTYFYLSNHVNVHFDNTYFLVFFELLRIKRR